jgi:subtilisin family serine protease
MLKKLKSFLVFAVLLVFGFIKVNSVFANNKSVSYVPGQILVKFTGQSGNVESSDPVRQMYQKFSVLSSRPVFAHTRPSGRKGTDLSTIYQLSVPQNTDIEKLCRQFQQEPFIEYAEPNYICEVHAVPNDSLYIQQGHLPQIHSEEAWDIARGDAGVVLAIAGTGVDWDHPDLAAAIWSNDDEVIDGIDNDGNGYIDDVRGWDFVNGVTNAADGEDATTPDNNPMDFDGHETHCAGLAAAMTNNLRGVAGVSWGCTIMPLRIGYKSKDGKGYVLMDAAAGAIVYATDNGAKVLNASWGNSGNTIKEAAKYAFENGVLIINSAGNGDNTPGTDPMAMDALATLPFIVNVAAVDDRDHKASYSSYGPWVTVSAPGGDPFTGRPSLLSTYVDDQYAWLQGTSMSAPVVTGLAGLIQSYHPDWSSADVLFQIKGTADNIESLNPKYRGMLGSGRVNAYRALTETVTAAPKIELLTYSVHDTTTGNANGLLDIGETAELVVTLNNNWGDANDVTVTFTVEDPEIQIINGTSHFGFFYGLRNLLQNSRSNRSEPFVLSIDANSVPRRINGRLHILADGKEETFELVIAIDPRILIIDDDGNSGMEKGVDVQKYYTEALDAIDASFDVWDVAKFGYKYAGVLKKYSLVLWFCEKTLPSLDDNDRYNIERYFTDRAGNLMLFGQDIGWDLCDATSDSNVYFVSKGKSKEWFEKYLQSRYIANTTSNHRILPVSGDPVGEGITFNFAQPDRSPAEQSPSLVEPLENGTACLVYPDGRPAAIRSLQTGPKGNYKTAYFFFGGIESIVDSDMQQQLLAQTINWMNGLTVRHIPLSDIGSSEARPVEVKIEKESGLIQLQRVDLSFVANGQYPATVISMTGDSTGTFSGIIPSLPAGVVEYTIIIKTNAGFYAPRFHYTYKVGQDTEAPSIAFVVKLSNTLDKKGPFDIIAKIIDHTQVNPEKIFIHYSSESVSEDSAKLQPTGLSDLFGGSFTGEFKYGDHLAYFITAEDVADPANRSVSVKDSVLIGAEDFENGLSGWLSDGHGNWNVESVSPHQGYFRLSDSPGELPDPDLNTTLTLKSPLDLSRALDATLSLWTLHALRFGKDYGYVEMSSDSGLNWIELAKVGGVKEDWYQILCPLGQYVGPDFGRILLRLRLATKSGNIPAQFTGWSVDDILITEQFDTRVQDHDLVVKPPDEFELAQNYPNPFNPMTTISYQLPQEGLVNIAIHNILGQKIRTLVNQKQKPGIFRVVWDGKNDQGMQMSTGLYLIVMKAGSYSAVRKTMLLK